VRPQADFGPPSQAVPPKLAIIIPTLNGAERVKRLCAELKNKLGYNISFTLIIIDDGSKPEQAQLLRQLAATEPCLRLVQLDANYGQRIATVVGTALADCELILTMDDDGSHPPEAILPALDFLQQRPELDLLYLAPRRRPASQRGVMRLPAGQHTAIRRPAAWRRLGTLANNFLFHACMGLPWQVPVGSFRLFRTELVKTALQRPVCWPYLSAMLLACRPQVAVQFYSPPASVKKPGRTSSTVAGSSYSPRKLTGLYLRLVWYWGPLKTLAGWFCRGKVFNPADYGVRA